MRYAKFALVIAILIIAASAAMADCPGTCNPKTIGATCPGPCAVEPQCPQVVTQTCPEPCPEPCPQPCPQPCPTVCPCPASVPAAVGAGPAAGLDGLTCPDFDPAFATRMYQQNQTIIAVTAYGMQKTTDRNLRNISGEINGYLTSANTKLESWNTANPCGGATCGGCGIDLTANCDAANAIIAELNAQPCECFDATYAKTLGELLRQSSSADEMGACKVNCGVMRDQARFLAAKESNWTMRLDRWVSDHY